jgi:soluble lytic murein transglycosylase-like protein
MSLARFILSASIVSTLCLQFPLKITRADIYRFKDKNGVWHFTNIPSDPRYRLYIKTNRLRTRRYIITYDEMIDKASKRFNVDPCLIKAIIKAESSFDPDAISENGAQGLMQLMPATAKDMKVNNPFDPEENIFGGTKYFSLLLRKFKQNKRMAIAAYNIGATTVANYNSVPPIPQTRRFVERVMEYYIELKRKSDQATHLGVWP